VTDHSFEAIVEAYQKQMYFVALHILHNHHDADVIGTGATVNICLTSLQNAPWRK
jgi:hypothetical protein